MYNALLLVYLEQFVFPLDLHSSVSVVVIVGEQVLKTSSSCITGLCQALIEQIVQIDRQMTGTFLHNSSSETYTIPCMLYAFMRNMILCPHAMHKQGLLWFWATFHVC